MCGSRLSILRCEVEGRVLPWEFDVSSHFGSPCLGPGPKLVALHASDEQLSPTGSLC